MRNWFTPLVALAALVGCSVARSPASLDTSLEGRLRAEAQQAPLIVAHRGDSDEFPENTLPAFRSALDKRVQLVECDFHQSKDGILYCIHDATLDRTTNAEEILGRTEIPIRDLTMAELRRLDAGSWKGPRFSGTRIPTLSETLDLVAPRAVPMIEHKSGRAEDLVRLLREKNLVDQVIVMSFDWSWLEHVHRLEPRLFLAALGRRRMTRGRHDAIRRTGAKLVHWSIRDIRLEDVQRLRRAGYMTCAFTVNGDAEMIGAGRLGLDAITTDRPSRLRELIDRGFVAR